MQNQIATHTLSLAILASSASADLIASSTFEGGFGSPYLDESSLMNLQLVETDVGFFEGLVYEIPVENPDIYFQWSFGANNLGNRLLLDERSSTWLQLIDLLTNGESDYFSRRQIFYINDPDAPASGIGTSWAVSDSDLLNTTNDLAGAAIDYIELELTSFEFFIDGEYNSPSISYTIDFNVYGTVPTPATLLPMGVLLFSRRRR